MPEIFIYIFHRTFSDGIWLYFKSVVLIISFLEVLGSGAIGTFLSDTILQILEKRRKGSPPAIKPSSLLWKETEEYHLRMPRADPES